MGAPTPPPPPPPTIACLNPKKDTAIVAQLIKLERRLFVKSQSYDAANLGTELARRTTVLLYTTTSTHTVTGYLMYAVHGGVAHLSKVLVAPEARRQGLARALVTAAIAKARKERRVGSVTLHVDTSNDAALGLYAGLGFVKEAEFEDYYTVGRHAYKMRLELEDGG
jgi:[ribosomal protein S18]-alanine N-acetyltransferase